MGKIHDRIVELEATLTNCRSDHEGYELAGMEEQLFRLRHIEEQMSAFCEGLYMRGYEAGKKSADGLSESEVKQAILQVKGIGEKKVNDIVQALTQAQAERKMLTDG